MSERIRRRKPKEINFPKDHKLIFLEKDDNVIAICTHKGCGNIIFKGNDKTQLGLRVLKERVLDHMSFYGEVHNVDIIHPRNGEPRITGPESLVTSFGVFDKNEQLPGV